MDSQSFKKNLTGVLVFVLLAGSFAAGQDRFNEDLLKGFAFRNLGPFRAGSWVTSFAVPSAPLKEHLYTFYVGTRNGGVWKTTNAGTTFEPIFDGQSKLSIGAVAVAPSNADIVWVGTGEAYCARSSNSGDGIYRSADAGKTWTNMGLKDSHHIARLAIHPKNPDIVYAVAMGHLFSNNAERGVFRTRDGGRTWDKVLYVNDKIGAIDVVMAQADPNVLYAAMYDKVRLPWHYEMGGPESGIYKTIDGGKTWKKLTGGLPSGKIGRIGLDIFQKNPDILYAVVENGNRRPPTQAEIDLAKKRGAEPGEPTAGNEVYRTDDGGKSWRKVNQGYEAALNKAPYSFNELKLDQNDPNTVYITGQSLASTTDGGKTWNGLSWPSNGVFQKAFGDWRAMWVDPDNSDRLLFGSDGGVNISYDRGRTCHHFYNIPLGEFYAIGVDMEDPYNIYGGMQDHDSWKGPSNGWAGEITLTDWVTVGGGDGMYNCVDPTDSRWLYNNREMGSMWRFDQKLGVQTPITPRRPPGKEALRFNWTPPIMLSPHNPAIVYTGAQILFRSLDRGDHWTEISPDLTANEKAKQGGAGNISYCTLTTISESPLTPGVIWAGSDDGKVQVSRDGGTTWSDRTAKIAAAGGPENFWVSRVLASPHDPGTAFVTKTGLRFDDFRACLFKTTDYGETWTSIGAGLPAKPVNVVVQDRKNANLLFAGTEQGVYLTIDGGKTWVPMKGNMPWVKVTDLVIHPRENDLVVGTYGRGLWIMNITPLQELNDKVLDQDVYLFDIKPQVQRVTGGIGNYQLLGDSHPMTPNEPNAVTINYYLKDKTAAKVNIKVTDPYGKVLRELSGKPEAGMNTVLWDMRAPRPQGQGAGGVPGGFGPGGGMVDPGEYVVTLEIGDKKLTKKALIPRRMGWALGPFPSVIK
jgi:photosystem II stability/assembly factor-like uncharacterized protein